MSIKSYILFSFLSLTFCSYATVIDSYSDSSNLSHSIEKKTNLVYTISKALKAQETQNYKEAIFYWKIAYEQTQDPEIQERILVLSNENNFQGYELSDWEEFINSYIIRPLPQISIVLAILFSFITLFLFYRALIKKDRNIGYALFLSILLIIGFTLVNIPINASQFGIVKQTTFLMDTPSSASHLIEHLNHGDCLKIKEDGTIWKKVTIGTQQGYVRSKDIDLMTIK